MEITTFAAKIYFAMKKLSILLLTLIVIASCSQQEKPKAENEDIQTKDISANGGKDDTKIKSNLGDLKPNTNITSGDKDNPRNFYNVGVRKYKSGDYEGAIAEFNKVIELKPDFDNAYYNRGLSFYSMKSYLEAELDFGKAIEINPRDSASMLHLGLIKYYKNKFKDAVEAYNAVIEKFPFYGIAFYNRGIAQGRLGYYDKAIDDFNTSITLDPTHSKSFFNRGLANFFDRDTAKACKDWKQAAKLGSSKAQEAVEAYCDRN